MIRRAVIVSALLALIVPVAAAQNWNRIAGVEEGVFSICINPLNPNTVWIGGFRKLLVSYDGGMTISRIVNLPFANGFYTTSVFIHPADTSFIMIGGAGVYLSRDDGQTWSHALPDTALFFSGESIVAEPNHPDTIYVGALLNNQDTLSFFFRSFDRGRTWSQISIPTITGRAGFCTIAAAGSGVLLGGTGTQGRISRGADYGNTWTQVYQSDTPAEIPKITIAKTDERTIYAAVQSLSPQQEGYVLRSTDRGLTWSPVLQSLGNPWAVETDAQGRVYAGMFGAGLPGAYVSFDEGSNWRNFRSGIPSIPAMGLVWMIKAGKQPFEVFLADGNTGAYKLQNLDVVKVKETVPVARFFHLQQNYPNPFNPTTMITFTLDRPLPVTLKVYDLAGHEVATLLHNVNKPAGKHSLIFDAAPLSSGLYFYELRAGVNISHKKMLLTK